MCSKDRWSICRLTNCMYSIYMRPNEFVFQPLIEIANRTSHNMSYIKVSIS